jgi:hypothetical protein
MILGLVNHMSDRDSMMRFIRHLAYFIPLYASSNNSRTVDTSRAVQNLID